MDIKLCLYIFPRIVIIYFILAKVRCNNNSNKAHFGYVVKIIFGPLFSGFFFMVNGSQYFQMREVGNN